MASKEQMKEQLEKQIKVLQDELDALNQPEAKAAAPKERHPDDEEDDKHADRKSAKSDR